MLVPRNSQSDLFFGTKYWYCSSPIHWTQLPSYSITHKLCTILFHLKNSFFFCISVKVDTNITPQFKRQTKAQRIDSQWNVYNKRFFVLRKLDRCRHKIIGADKTQYAVLLYVCISKTYQFLCVSVVLPHIIPWSSTIKV